MLCQITLKRSRYSLTKTFIWLSQFFKQQEVTVKIGVSLLICFIFFFPSDNIVNSVGTWWMCFHLSRMMANVGRCSRSSSREITLISVDDFIIKTCCRLSPSRKLTVYFHKIYILLLASWKHCLRIAKKQIRRTFQSLHFTGGKNLKAFVVKMMDF